MYCVKEDYSLINKFLEIIENEPNKHQYFLIDSIRFIINEYNGENEKNLEIIDKYISNETDLVKKSELIKEKGNILAICGDQELAEIQFNEAKSLINEYQKIEADRKAKLPIKDWGSIQYYGKNERISSAELIDIAINWAEKGRIDSAIEILTKVYESNVEHKAMLCLLLAFFYQLVSDIYPKVPDIHNDT